MQVHLAAFSHQKMETTSFPGAEVLNMQTKLICYPNQSTDWQINHRDMQLDGQIFI